MRLDETALAIRGLPEDVSATANRQAFIVGHAYAASLGGLRTPFTWKLLVCAVTDRSPLTVPMLSSDEGGVGVDMIDLAVNASDYFGAGSDWDQRRALLRWLHEGSVAIGRAQGWDERPFEAAQAAVEAEPEFRIVGSWKGRAGRTRARLVLTETLEGVTAALEVEGGTSPEARLSHEAAWMARKALSDPRWLDGGWVVLDESNAIMLRAGA